MKEEKEEIIRKALNLINCINNIITAVIDEDKKDLIYWQKSSKTWKGYLDKRITRHLKKIEKEKVPF